MKSSHSAKNMFSSSVSGKLFIFLSNVNKAKNVKALALLCLFMVKLVDRHFLFTKNVEITGSLHISHRVIDLKVKLKFSLTYNKLPLTHIKQHSSQSAAKLKLKILVQGFCSFWMSKYKTFLIPTD